MEQCADYVKGLFVLIGSLLAFLSPIGVFILIAILATFADVWSAWRLSVRVRKRTGLSLGKFKSDSAMKAFRSLISFSYVAILGFLCDRFIMSPEDLYCLKMVTGAYTFVQVYSILENTSSESDETWAKILQKIMVNKANRHFDLDFTT